MARQNRQTVDGLLAHLNVIGQGGSPKRLKEMLEEVKPLLIKYSKNTRVRSRFTNLLDSKHSGGDITEALLEVLKDNPRKTRNEVAAMLMPDPSKRGQKSRLAEYARAIREWKDPHPGHHPKLKSEQHPIWGEYSTWAPARAA